MKDKIKKATTNLNKHSPYKLAILETWTNKERTRFTDKEDEKIEIAIERLEEIRQMGNNFNEMNYRIAHSMCEELWDDQKSLTVNNILNVEEYEFFDGFIKISQWDWDNKSKHLGKLKGIYDYMVEMRYPDSMLTVARNNIKSLEDDIDDIDYEKVKTKRQSQFKTLMHNEKTGERCYE